MGQPTPQRDPRDHGGSVERTQRVGVGFMDLPEAAQWFSVSPKTVRRWIGAFALPCYRIPGPSGKRGRLLFREGELARWSRRFKAGTRKTLDAAAAEV